MRAAMEQDHARTREPDHARSRGRRRALPWLVVAVWAIALAVALPFAGELGGVQRDHALAHSITLIGVQSSVAAHVLVADPDRLDRDAVARALDDISGTCRDARADLRTTLEVLRADGQDTDGPLPDLAALAGLVRAAEAAGAKVNLAVRTPEDRFAPATGSAAYRIVQESLTNAVRHGGPGVTVRVTVEPRGNALHVMVSDDGQGPQLVGPGFGIIGMRERARSAGGTLVAGPRPGGGFEVSALLPFHDQEATP